MRHHAFFLLIAILLTSCGGDGGSHHPQTPGGEFTPPDLSNTLAYSSSTPYEPFLRDCAIAESEAELCIMEALPLIGQATAAPTTQDIADRLVVSHPWMGDRFLEALELLPPDIKTLLKGVTAIVIDDDIRPAYYSSNTAAIYIDPAYLWLTLEEKGTISRVADFRSNYGQALQFLQAWRYVKNSDYAYYYYSLDGTETRQINDILYPLAALLYHELAHANDMVPPSRIASLDRSQTPREAVRTLDPYRISLQLEESAPLTSQVWKALARVLYFGEPVSAAQSNYTASFVGNDFHLDAANWPYAYATPREDVAILFEEAMMKYHFDIDRDIAFLPRPLANARACDDYIVKWGRRNRLGEPRVKARAAFVAAELLPSSDLTTFFSNFPAPKEMTVNLGWCSNLDLGAPTVQSLGLWRSSSAERISRDILPPGY